DFSSLLFAIPEQEEQLSESEKQDRKGLTRADVAMDAIRQHVSAKSVASELAKEDANKINTGENLEEMKRQAIAKHAT
ncbi:unnamed protein product, partial [Amoebophrya sp. A25]